MALDYRYQALDFNGKILSTGNKLYSVCAFGRRIIIDYKLMRHTVQTSMYPQTRYNWHNGISDVGNILHRVIKVI